MFRFIILLTVVAYAVCANTPTDMSYDDLLEKQFQQDNEVAQVCKCVDHDQCTSDFGAGKIERRIGGENCICECAKRNRSQCINGTINAFGRGILQRRILPVPDVDDKRSCNGYWKCCTADGCGYRNYPELANRITGGDENEAKYAEFPWTVAVFFEENLLGQKTLTYECAGSLIHPSVVLTVAHCVTGKIPSGLKIRAGEWDTQTDDEILPHQERRVSEYIIHEDYDDEVLLNDVALLFLAEKVKIAANVNTICLPPRDQNFDLQRCFASGWGKNVSGNEGVHQGFMKRVELPVVPRDKCLTELKKTDLGQNFQLHSSFICAGGEPGKDTCEGDGGAPLVCPIPNTRNRYYQVGMVSWGMGCGGSTPGVYVNVPLFRNWIEEKLRVKEIFKVISFVPV